jgi:hypothetical protein
MIRPIAFCFGVALAWCGTADAQISPAVLYPPCPAPGHICCAVSVNGQCTQTTWSPPDDTAKVEIDDLKEQVKELRELLKALLPSFLQKCSGDPPERLPRIEKREAE